MNEAGVTRPLPIIRSGWTGLIQKLTILISVVLLQFAPVTGQTKPSECKTNESSPPIGHYAWSSDAQVKVYFVRDMFTQEQRQALLRGMASWSESAKRNGLGVTLLYVGDTDGPRSCANCLTVNRREVYKNDRRHYAYFIPVGMNAEGVLRSAWIDIDVATTDPKALQGFMAHELGHGMGLWDCPQCKNKQTIMRAFPGINKDNGLVAPSVCDLEVVRQVFEKRRRLANNNTQATAFRVESSTP
jgi:hypothetical protein